MTSEPLLSEIEEQAELPVEDHSARNRLVIGLLLVSAFVVILNETIMGVAIPHLMADLKIPASSAQWLTSAFMLTMATVIPVTGFLLQRLNTRPVFILAMSLFSAGTLVCALAPGFPMLVVGRIVQASGTAIMMPLLMTTIMNLVPPHSRGKTMGNISIVISVAPAIGPTISGLILSSLDWRWLFLLVLPIALAALALGASKIENVTVPSKAPLDVISVVLSAIGFGSFVFGISELGAPEAGTTPLDPRVMLAAGAAVIAVFVWRQIHLQKHERALLDLRTLQTKTFTIAAGMMAILMMSMFGVFILIPIYLLSVLGQTTLTAGLLLLPGGLIMGLCAPFVGRLFDRYGPARLVIPGALLFSSVMWGLTFLTVTTPIWVVLGLHIVMSIGLALMFTPLFTVSLGSLPPKLYSHGSAIIGTTQQVAGAAGTTLYVAIMTWRAGILTQGEADAATATVGGMQSAFFVGALISLAAVVASFYVRRPPAQPEGQSMGH
ncbi:DHA2 family lincomycin resistance protein-like MFS transporter [Rhizobium sp. BK275]|uniref:MDR family MFS transporter n=1 Tax=unclassified Rhizobium TaxID=2613769 RepID=UPI00161E3150|nr:MULTISPECIES: MDR family MFS transporter [unclassified Rhizobium]MBB3393240.1 DHA2 family lincomycin resistance protein-like MFS transporter [Rhizobium sp. BK275]MBB3409740.1 DHA2 family lincomycin resistance protein-like MFS transporter [Rhizobium sp. BK316]